MHKLADDSINEVVRHSQDNTHRPLRKFKHKDLPITDKTDASSVHSLTRLE